MENEASYNKYEVCKAALRSNPTIFIHIDATIDSVIVPSQYFDKNHLVLQVGYNMPIPIPDLKLTERGLSGTLSFKGNPFWCQIPWSAVFCIIGELGGARMWEDTVPPDVLKTIVAESFKETEKQKVKGQLKLVKNASSGPLRVVNKDRSHLKVVK